MGKIYNNSATGHVFVEDTDGRLGWSTQFRPVNLLPESSWLTLDQAISFPDFDKFVNYGHERRFNPPSDPSKPSYSGDTCQTVTMIRPEERTLSEITLGSVPDGCNFIDVRINLARTKAPTNYLDDPVPSLVPLGQWVPLPGGSCLVEATGIWRRLFDIVLVSNTVRLRRFQSVISVGDVAPTDGGGNLLGIYNNYWPTPLTSDAGRNPWGQSSYSRWGWISGGDFAGSQRNGHPAALIDSKNYSANTGHDTPSYGAKHPRRSNSCSINNSSHDFSSTYQGQIVIRSGYVPG